MTLSPDPVVLTFPVQDSLQDNPSQRDVLRRLEEVTDELLRVRRQILEQAHGDRHVRAAAHRLDDAAFTCRRALDELGERRTSAG